MGQGDRYMAYISCITPIAEMFLAGYCLGRLAGPFLERKKGAFYAGAAYTLTELVFYVMPWPRYHFLPYGTGVFIAFLVMCRMDRRNYGQKAFIAVTFFSLRRFTFATAEILYDKLYAFAENTDYMMTHPDRSPYLFLGVCIFYLLAEFLFTLAGIRCILKCYVYKHAEMSEKELAVMVIPSFLGVFGYEVIWCYRSFYLGRIGGTSAVYDVLSLFYYTAAVITIVAVIVLYQKIRAGQEEKLQNELLVAQMDSIRKHIGQVEELYRDIRGIRHDMRNHIITLERLYAGNKTKEAVAYGTKLREVLSEVAGGAGSGNPVTDVILQEMQGEAEKKKIRFEADFHYPAGSKVDAFDISVILNNALQNALENSVKSTAPFISVLSYRRNNAYMIEINNSFTGHLRWDAESGLPVTSKGERGGPDCGHSHGYGLGNIRKVAEKYSGDIDIVQKDGTFCLSILLMLE